MPVQEASVLGINRDLDCKELKAFCKYSHLALEGRGRKTKIIHSSKPETVGNEVLAKRRRARGWPMCVSSVDPTQPGTPHPPVLTGPTLSRAERRGMLAGEV